MQLSLQIKNLISLKIVSWSLKEMNIGNIVRVCILLKIC